MDIKKLQAKLKNRLIGVFPPKISIGAVPYLPLAFIALIIIRTIRPLYLIRWRNLIVHALGHFALNTELYLCERDAGINVPKQRYIDLLYIKNGDYVSSYALLDMWRRVLRIYPAGPMEALEWLNNIIPGGATHNIGANTNNDRDVHDLMANSMAHLSFTNEEELAGQAFLRSLGIPEGSSFICLNVRDDAYYKAVGMSNDRHSYRDSDIKNYVEAAEWLAKEGYYVVRMGRKVNNPLVSTNKRIIDYAHSGMGDDFTDIYIAANCFLCISTSTGFDALPAIFRRPIAIVNMVPIESVLSSSQYVCYIGKHYWDKASGRELSLSQIVALGLVYKNYTHLFAENDVELVECSSREICDVAIEAILRLEGRWLDDPLGNALQNKFRELMPLDLCDNIGRPLHGDFYVRYSETYLIANEWWVS